MITRDKPGLSRKTRFCGTKPGISIAKLGFFIDIPDFSNQCFKNLPFLPQNLVLWRKAWFNRAKPGFAPLNQVLLFNVHLA